MKACTARAISNFPSARDKHFYLEDIQSPSLYKLPSLVKQSNKGLRWNNILSPMVAKSDEKASDAPFYVNDDEHELVPVVEYSKVNTKENDVAPVDAESHEGSWPYTPRKMFKFLEDFDVKGIKLDSEEIYSILVFGGGGVVALWLAASVVKAVDSIPLFPKALELVGLGYTIWFSSRYLIFKKNRDELLDKIEEVKLRVIGTSNENNNSNHNNNNNV